MSAYLAGTDVVLMVNVQTLLAVTHVRAMRVIMAMDSPVLVSYFWHILHIHPFWNKWWNWPKHLEVKLPFGNFRHKRMCKQPRPVQPKCAMWEYNRKLHLHVQRRVWWKWQNLQWYNFRNFLWQKKKCGKWWMDVFEFVCIYTFIMSTHLTQCSDLTR